MSSDIESSPNLTLVVDETTETDAAVLAAVPHQLNEPIEDTEKWIKDFDDATLAISKRILKNDAEVTLLSLPKLVVTGALVGSLAVVKSVARNTKRMFSHGE